MSDFYKVSDAADNQLGTPFGAVRSSCVVVVDNERVVGILTEQDVVRLNLQQQPLNTLVMQQVMLSPVVTLQESAFTDVNTAIHLLKQHHVRHLAILDNQDRLVGLITDESLQQSLNAYQLQTEQNLRQQVKTRLQETETVLHNIVEGTTTTTGQGFFPALASYIASALNISAVLVTEMVDEELRSLAFWANGALQPAYQYHPARTPCGRALQEGQFYCAGSVQQMFPEDSALVELGAESYLGIALRDSRGKAIGNLGIFHQQPIHFPNRAKQILRVFGARAAAELERQRALTSLEHLNQELEIQVIERTAKLQHKEAQLRAIIEAIPDLLLHVGRDGTCFNYIHSPNAVGEFLPIQQELAEVLPPALLQQ
ncbi:MAG: CBS domain-containing protein, partial [Cyanobacteria bacterium J06626_4]